MRTSVPGDLFVDFPISYAFAMLFYSYNEITECRSNKNVEYILK